jgi:hypothetical protein
MITCYRIGFTSRRDETPEHALTELLQRVESNGFLVVSVSVVRPGRLPGEAYEAYIVTRSSPDDDGLFLPLPEEPR